MHEIEVFQSVTSEFVSDPPRASARAFRSVPCVQPRVIALAAQAARHMWLLHRPALDASRVLPRPGPRNRRALEALDQPPPVTGKTEAFVTVLILGRTANEAPIRVGAPGHLIVILDRVSPGTRCGQLLSRPHSDDLVILSGTYALDIMQAVGCNGFSSGLAGSFMSQASGPGSGSVRWSDHVRALSSQYLWRDPPFGCSSTTMLGANNQSRIARRRVAPWHTPLAR